MKTIVKTEINIAGDKSKFETYSDGSVRFTSHTGKVQEFSSFDDYIKGTKGNNKDALDKALKALEKF